MGDEIQVSTNTQKSKYVGAQAGIYSGPQTRADAIVVFGGKVEKNGLYAAGQVGAGTALTASVELGKNIKLGDNLSLTTAVESKTLRNNIPSSVIVACGPDAVQVTYHDGFSQAGLKGMIGYSNDKFSVKGGLEAGYRATYGNTSSCVSNNTLGVFATTKDGMSVTPKLEVQYKSLVADASLNEVNIGYIRNF